MQKSQRPQGYWRLPEFSANLPQHVIEQLEQFYSELIRFNSKMNLIQRRTELDADIVHFLDCVEASQIILADTKAKQIFDIGSGNGLPGLVLAIIDPTRDLVLVDPDERKNEFLKHIVQKLNLKNVTVMTAKLEDLEPNMVACAVSRGLTSISKTIIAARGIVRSGGDYYHLKGSTWVREVADIPSQLCSYWTPGLVKEYVLPVVITKMAVIKTKKVG